MNAILTVRDLSVHFRQGKRLVQLVDRVSFSVARGECLGILGESGSGKSMTCKALLGLLDDNFQVTGSSRFEGRPLLSQTAEQLRRLRGGKISMVLQNPMSCFDPLYRIGEQMAETLQEHTALNGRALQKRMEAILRLMRIHDPADVLRKYPHQLSGGMLQRVMIGLAICMQPSLIIADEPTTAIDSISQYAIMQEFLRIKRRGEVSMIFISHDLGVLSLIADKVIVMHDGKAVESASDLMLVVRSKNPGDTVTLTVNSAGQSKDVQVTLGDDSATQQEKAKAQSHQQSMDGYSLEDLFGQRGMEQQKEAA